MAISGSHAAWWYGRAIKVYFGISILLSFMWILKHLYVDMPTASAPFALGPPAQQYSQAFTDHIYCLNVQNRLGRHARMRALLEYMHLDGELFTGRQISHLDVWRNIINNNFRHALVIEDDVDFEVDFVERIAKAMAAVQRKKWDILYVGHCSMDEGQGKPRGQDVFKATKPFCTSGYIVSRSGAQKLFAYFVRNLSAATLDLLNAYSLFPPAVFQRRDLYPADDGMELKISKLLTNSAWDEARRLEPRLANWTEPLDRHTFRHG
ncbi:hypothetical protein DL89DRAFT_289991 [Linderina pennispora]|uniref:Glycosyl transferase family 25 domain-containing protein n=1 Tax=Linderina pennispora TaxID=61395 RepID=A0A1Y1WMA9_9FUNG|nr:uncharacterized protein DL89DRAFT_289991 [Linderina pennispora]ORX74428.1 hypothetical protein DL89DRAFT_289991 [Linderina pennispora]